MHMKHYTHEQARAAAGVSEDVYASWREAGLPLFPVGNTGVSKRDILFAAAAFELAKQGLTPHRACLYAASWAHSGDEEIDPGHVYPDGETLLVAGPGDEFAIVVRESEAGSLVGRTSLHLNPIVERVEAALAKR